MKIFVFSYVVSVISLISVFHSTVQAAPLETIGHILVYAGFPSAIVLSLILVVLGYFIGTSKQELAGDSHHTNSGQGAMQNAA